VTPAISAFFKAEFSNESLWQILLETVPGASFRGAVVELGVLRELDQITL